MKYNTQFTVFDDKWNYRFLNLAKHVSEWSKDSGCKVGAVIVRPNRSIASIGFNGFPIGVIDDPKLINNRDIKLQKVVHGEINAILFTQENLNGYVLFTWPFLPCGPCSSIVIQSGIKSVISTNYIPPKWRNSVAISLQQFKEAGVLVKQYLVKWVKK